MPDAFTATFGDHTAPATSLVLTRGVAQVDATATIHLPPSADWSKVTAAEQVTIVTGDLSGRRTIFQGRPRTATGSDAGVAALASFVEDIKRQFTLHITAADETAEGYVVMARAIESRRGTTRDIQRDLRTYLGLFIQTYRYRVEDNPLHTFLGFVDFLAARRHYALRREGFTALPYDIPASWSNYITKGRAPNDDRQVAPIQSGDAVVQLFNETMRTKGDYNTLATTLERYGILVDAWDGAAGLRFYATATPLQVWDTENGRSTPIIIPADFTTDWTISYPDWSNKASDDWERRQILIPYSTQENTKEVTLVRPNPTRFEDEYFISEDTFGPDSKGPIFYSTQSYETLEGAILADAIEREYLRTHTQRLVMTIPSDWWGLFPGYQLQIEGRPEIWRIEGLNMSIQTSGRSGTLNTTITAWRHHEGVPPAAGSLPILGVV